MSSECLSTVRCFGGEQHRFKHRSRALNCDMIYAVYLPPQAAERSVPVVYYLSGLTCTDESFTEFIVVVVGQALRSFSRPKGVFG